jgi:hypothetical protein
MKRLAPWACASVALGLVTASLAVQRSTRSSRRCGAGADAASARRRQAILGVVRSADRSYVTSVGNGLRSNPAWCQYG